MMIEKAVFLWWSEQNWQVDILWGQKQKITGKNISQHKYCLIIQNIW